MNKLSSTLRELMSNHEECNTVMKLATVLYERDLVHVNQKEYPFDDGTEKRKNAIGSIVKKVRQHLNENSKRMVQGEFLNAYAELFGCSVDYLLGRTDILSPDIDVQQICLKTGLSEKAVVKLMDESMPQWLWHDVWSILIESDLYESLPGDWFSFCGSLMYEAGKSGSIEARSDPKALEGLSEEERLKEEEYTRKLENDKHTYQAAAYGALYKMTRDISLILENEAKRRSDLSGEREEARDEEFKALMTLKFLRGDKDRI